VEYEKKNVKIPEEDEEAEPKFGGLPFLSEE